MHHLTQKLDSLQECIKKGEKCRILYDILLSEIGMNYEDDGHSVWKKLGEVQDEYYESIKMLKEIMESGQRKTDTEPPDWLQKNAAEIKNDTGEDILLHENEKN